MSNQLTFYDETAEGWERSLMVRRWGYVESMSHVLLGRPLDEHERGRRLAGMVLN